MFRRTDVTAEQCATTLMVSPLRPAPSPEDLQLPGCTHTTL